MGLLDAFKKEKTASKATPGEMLDDVTFIRAIKHIPASPWHQYDVLLAARGYGWNMMIAWADYMSQADLEQISQVTTGSCVLQEENITKSYSKSGGKCSQTPELQTEMGVLLVAGISKALKAPMKIVWINQTQVLRFFTSIDDELLMKNMSRRSYAEPSARKTR